MSSSTTQTPLGTRAATLLKVARDISATLDLDSLITQVEQAARDVLDCERVTVFLHDGESDELWSRFATGTSEIRFPAKQGIAGEAFGKNTTVNVPDAYADPRFNQQVDKATGYRTRNLLTIPMTGHEGEAVGVLQVLNKRGGAFDDDDEQLAATLGSLTGVAVQRQLLLDEYTEKQKLMRDLAVAREIQESFLPRETPTINGFLLAGWNRPADDTGGDTFDFIELEDGRLAILLADATGHGIGPALMASECRALIRAISSVNAPLGDVVSKSNAILHEDLTLGRFLTLFLGQLNPDDGRMEYISAGQAPLLLYRRARDETVTFDATTCPMGVLPFMDVTPAEPVDFDSGDIFVLASDGFYEWMNPQGDDFGVDGVANVLRNNRDAEPDEIIEALNKAVLDFAEGTPQDDDLTAVVIKRV